MNNNLVTKSFRMLVISAAVIFSSLSATNSLKAQTAPAADSAAAAAAAPAADMGYLTAANWEQYKDQMVGDGYGPDLVKNAIPSLMGRSTKDWRAGAALTPDLVKSIPAGTAIASFDETGVYTNTSGQSQAALFVAPFAGPDGKVMGFYYVGSMAETG